MQRVTTIAIAVLWLLVGLLATEPAGASYEQRPREITCVSVGHQYAECPTPFGGPARMSRQTSFIRCLEGRNWGSRPGLVWVDEGCSGRFTEDRKAWPGWRGAAQRRVLCESRDNHYQQCNTDFRGPARLDRQLSQDACTQGRSWGQMRGMVWVSRGCRAWFEDSAWDRGGYPGGDGFSITCSSDNGEFRSCAWNDRYGRPRLIEQLSDRRCDEGRSWGYRNGSIWVNNGCRGRFGPG